METAAIIAKGIGSPTRKPWNLLKEQVSLPALALSSSLLEHNLTWMQSFIRHYPGFLLAPHGKTPMCPTIFHKQLSLGAWGITLATPIQVQLAHSFGIKRILLANQLVGFRNMENIAELQSSDPEFDFYCIVDSIDNVRALGKFFQERQQTLKILLEYGPDGGRTGVRNVKQEMAVLNEIKVWSPSLQLTGVEFYEGILPSIETVRLFVQNIVLRTLHLIKLKAFDTDEVIVTGSGSAWFDVVAQELSVMPKLVNPITKKKVQVLLRPGCYVTHGVKMFEGIENRLLHDNPVDGEPLQPALTLWAYVQSIPEANLAIIALGKRDALNDCGFPVVKAQFRPGVHEKPVDVRGKNNWSLFKMMDQHSFLQIEPGADLAIGDILIFDIVHPCTIFDKWKHVLVVNDNYEVEDVLETYF